MARGTKWRRYKVITLMFFATNDTFTIAAKKGLSWCRLVPQLHEICNCYRPFPDFGAFLFWKEWLWGFSSLFLKENNVKSSVDSTVVLQYRAAGFPRPLVHAATKTKSYCQHLYQLNEFHIDNCHIGRCCASFLPSYRQGIHPYHLLKTSSLSSTMTSTRGLNDHEWLYGETWIIFLSGYPV